jgi:predicted TPR repeat methyltransferase
MANENQFKLKTLFIGTRGVQEYRASIQTYIDPEDRVLEVGCEWGTTSEFLFARCNNLIATDISLDCIKKAREIRSHIHFETLDVYDIRKAQSFGIDFNKMYIDVSGLSGYRSVLDVIALLNMYSSVFHLTAIVVKSGALKDLSKRCIPWEGRKE